MILGEMVEMDENELTQKLLQADKQLKHLPQSTHVQQGGNI